DNDGLRDIFIANGIYKDLLDRDYLAYAGSKENLRELIRQNNRNAIEKLIDWMPQSSFLNYAFRNDGDLHFTNITHEWGFTKPMFTNGSAYGDLDNDGDLDLVVNNINSPSLIYQNNSDSAKTNSIRITVSSRSQNTWAVGTEVVAFCGGSTFHADNFVTRGFQSCVQPRIHIGLGEISSVDSMMIRWPDTSCSMIYQVPVNQELHFVKEQMMPYTWPAKSTGVKEKFKLNALGSVFRHRNSGLVDFNRDRLLPMSYSDETPFLIKGDIDRDGLDEIFIDGGKGRPGAFIEFSPQKAKPKVMQLLNQLSLAEETKGVLIDVDGDGDLDLYRATGGRFFPNTSDAMMDAIFLNDGHGNFSSSDYPLPFKKYFSTSLAMSLDYDRDGDQDIVVGERFDPFSYGVGGRGYLLENDSRGLFKDVTETKAPALLNAGMISDGLTHDFDGDGWEDIFLVGDWMPLKVFQNINGNFADVSREIIPEGTVGWWHDIEKADLNKDGKIDLVVANHGRNTFFRPGDRMYVADFDGNGSVEQIFCTRVDGKYYPMADKDELVSQLPAIKKQLLYYREYAKKSIEELFPEPILRKARVFEVNILSSIVFLSGPGKYSLVLLPLEAQYSPLYSLLILDVDKDGVDDLLAGGNQFQVKPQFGRYDASKGWLFKGTLEEGNFKFQRGRELGIDGQIRDIEFVDIDGVKYILFAKHDGDLEIYTLPN
ncbi:MAG: FG-GAP-like repeat-containing protein, partial [Bacteroidota bacterium]